MAQSLLLLPSSFTHGFSFVIPPPQILSTKRRSVKLRSNYSGCVIRCEQGAKKEEGLDTWLSRGAMLSFTVALTVELTTGKGVLENLGLTAPLPTVALVLTALVGTGAAIFIFQSASRD